MSAILSKLPLTYEELVKLAGNELVRVPASFDEYWHFIGQAEFRADFYQNEIITISYENEHHSEIMMDFAFLLQQAFPKTTRKFIVHKIETEYTEESDSFTVNNFTFHLKDIYFQLKFDK